MLLLEWTEATFRAVSPQLAELPKALARGGRVLRLLLAPGPYSHALNESPKDSCADPGQQQATDTFCQHG